MFIQKSIQFHVVVAALLLTPQAYAQSSYVGPLNAELGNGASVSCSACHSGSATENNATLPMATTWRTGAHLALSDSDGDGFNNAQEVSGASTNFNYLSVSPFTLAKAAEGSTSPNVVVVGGGIVNETPITDVYAQAGISAPTVGKEIAANVSPEVQTFPATIFFNRGITPGSKVYVADFATQTSTLLTTGVSYNANGSITVSGVTGPANIIVERIVPVVPPPGPPRGGEEEGFECVTGQLSMPLLIFFALLMLGFMIKRKHR